MSSTAGSREVRKAILAGTVSFKFEAADSYTFTDVYSGERFEVKGKIEPPVRYLIHTLAVQPINHVMVSASFQLCCGHFRNFI